MKGKCILVFDDDADLLDIFKFLFEEKGWQVFVFNNCTDIADKVRETDPDLILMDNWIPPAGGIVATQEIKKTDNIKNIPVIYISANNNIKELAEQAGADAYVAKPFEFHYLQQMAEELLNNNP